MSIYHPTQIVFYTFYIYEWPLVKRVYKKVVFTYQNTQKNVSLRRLFEHPKQLCKKIGKKILTIVAKNCIYLNKNTH